MTTQFALDLRLARRKSGLTQRDAATLLALDPGTVSALEYGKRLPTLTEIVTLSVLYGRSFESLFAEMMRKAKRDLMARMGSLAAKVRGSAATFNREATLTRLARDLRAEQAHHGA